MPPGESELESLIRQLLTDIDAFDKSGTFAKLKSAAAARAALTKCSFCGSKAIDTTRSTGEVFCNECERTGLSQ